MLRMTGSAETYIRNLFGDLPAIPQLKEFCDVLARIAGWSAHRIEEIVSANKIIRPAYKSLVKRLGYSQRSLREGKDGSVSISYKAL